MTPPRPSGKGWSGRFESMSPRGVDACEALETWKRHFLQAGAQPEELFCSTLAVASFLAIRSVSRELFLEACATAWDSMSEALGILSELDTQLGEENSWHKN